MTDRDPRMMNGSLDRQMNPEPPAQPPAPVPSLRLYATLVIVAVVMIVAAFRGGESWPSFCMNLSTDILMAIIILLVVDHRLRQDDLRLFMMFPLRTRQTVEKAVFPGARCAVGYARVLMSQLLKVEKPYLESRLDLERALEAKLRAGVVLVGGDGSGKTTLIQRMIRTQIAEVMRAPRNARIPVLVEGGKWRDGSVEKALLETMRGYYPVSDGAFQGFLRRGRLICFFEGVDEAFAPRERFEELARFARKYPGNAVVLSVKPRAAETDEVLRRLGLERFDVPPLSEEERAWLQEMKARRAPGA